MTPPTNNTNWKAGNHTGALIVSGTNYQKKNTAINIEISPEESAGPLAVINNVHADPNACASEQEPLQCSSSIAASTSNRNPVQMTLRVMRRSPDEYGPAEDLKLKHFQIGPEAVASERVGLKKLVKNDKLPWAFNCSGINGKDGMYNIFLDRDSDENWLSDTYAGYVTVVVPTDGFKAASATSYFSFVIQDDFVSDYNSDSELYQMEALNADPAACATWFEQCIGRGHTLSSATNMKSQSRETLRPCYTRK